jgi:aryl-alcohol dehydrogenase-like predicted oxidoreductase
MERVKTRLPLASGVLSGKLSRQTRFPENAHRNYNRDGQAFSVGETFSGIPFERGVELVEELKGKVPTDVALAQVALRWILDHPAVSTIIAGVTKPAQLEDNVAATRLPPLPQAVMADLASWYSQRVRPHVRGEI